MIHRWAQMDTDAGVGFFVLGGARVESSAALRSEVLTSIAGGEVRLKPALFSFESSGPTS